MEPEKQPLAIFDRVIGPLLGAIAGILLFCLMLLTCVDVIGRYFFNTPVAGGFELLDPITPDWLLPIQHVVSCLICAVATGYLAWRLWIRATNMAAAGETTAQLKLQI